VFPVHLVPAQTVKTGGEQWSTCREPLKPAPRVSWADELRLRRLIWEVEGLLLDPPPGVGSSTGLSLAL
jgi:hypothetical protein